MKASSVRTHQESCVLGATNVGALGWRQNRVLIIALTTDGAVSGDVVSWSVRRSFDEPEIGDGVQ